MTTTPKTRAGREILALLQQSHWTGQGPHGRTIWAVMKRVEALEQQVPTKTRVLLRKTGATSGRVMRDYQAHW